MGQWIVVNVREVCRYQIGKKTRTPEQYYSKRTRGHKQITGLAAEDKNIFVGVLYFFFQGAGETILLILLITNR